MIAALILAGHGCLLIVAVVSRWRRRGASEGILAGAFVIIIFSVGWTLASLLTGILVPPEGFASWMDADTVSLVLVTLGETALYYGLLVSKTPENPGQRGRDASADGTGR